MPPETTTVVTFGEVSRGLTRVEEGQARILAKLDSDVVTRREFEAFRADVTGRRVPWTAVGSLVVAALALPLALFG